MAKTSQLLRQGSNASDAIPSFTASCHVLFSLLIGTFVGTLIGGVVTWFVGRWYYKQSAEDLKKSAEGLRAETARAHLTSSGILYRPENPNARIAFRRDADSYLVRWDVIATGSSM